MVRIIKSFGQTIKRKFSFQHIWFPAVWGQWSEITVTEAWFSFFLFSKEHEQRVPVRAVDNYSSLFSFICSIFLSVWSFCSSSPSSCWHPPIWLIPRAVSLQKEVNIMDCGCKLNVVENEADSLCSSSRVLIPLNSWSYLRLEQLNIKSIYSIGVFPCEPIYWSLGVTL